MSWFELARAHGRSPSSYPITLTSLPSNYGNRNWTFPGLQNCSLWRSGTWYPPPPTGSPLLMQYLTLPIYFSIPLSSEMITFSVQIPLYQTELITVRLAREDPQGLCLSITVNSSQHVALQASSRPRRENTGLSDPLRRPHLEPPWWPKDPSAFL